MSRSRLPFVLVLLLICVLGFSVGLTASFVWRLRPRVVLEPRRFLLVQDPLEGEKVKVNLVLRNDSRRQLSVLRSVGSCACAEMKTWGGQSLLKPASLPPGSAMPWQLEIDTTNRPGRQKFRVIVECEDNGRIIPVISDIDIRVRPGMRVEPSTLLLGEIPVGQVSQREFVVVDALPDPGTKIETSMSSCADRLTVRLERVDGAEMTLGSDARVTVRYRGHICCNPTENGRLFHDWIALVPSGAKQSPVTIPVIYRTPESEYKLAPSSLILTSSSVGQECYREVHCFLRTGANPTVRVLSKPEHVRVAVRDVNATTKAIKVTCMVPERAELLSDGEIVFGAGNDYTAVCRLPIKFLP